MLTKVYELHLLSSVSKNLLGVCSRLFSSLVDPDDRGSMLLRKLIQMMQNISLDRHIVHSILMYSS
jgi:hypothetical protein